MIKNYPFNIVLLASLLTFVFSAVHAQEQPLAFPGAEGFGRFTSGGRGGEVYEVTNLNDSGPGSFRQGVEMSGARTIVFKISGTIQLETDLRIRNGNLTIAGQTAPGEGIAIKGSGVIVDADNVIIRYIRFRPGDILARELDAIWGRENKDLIIDHCSMSWSTDEVGSFYDNENFTMQWCILSESLFESVHDKGRHGYGGIWGGMGATFHHNLLAHHSSRNPRFNGARYTSTPETEVVDFRNNVIFNWGGNSAYGGEEGNQNMVANYYKPGPATGGGEKQYRIVDAYALDGELGKWYVADNFVEGYPEVSANNWNGGVQRLSAEEEAIARVYEPFPFAPVTTQTAEAAFVSVLAEAGANYPFRDPVDARIVEETATGEVTYGGAYGAGKGIIDTQETVGGWPELFSAPAPEDTDHDGMPDSWELAQGLDPQNPEDGKADLDQDGYTNLEEYLNALLETEPAEFLKHPTGLTAGEVTTSSITLSWENNAGAAGEIMLERSVNTEDNYAVIATLPGNTTTYVDEALEAGQVYYYRLQVVSGAVQSAYSTPLAVQTHYEPMAPDQDKLVAYWGFNATGGVAVEDLSVYDNHGEIAEGANTTWVAGHRSNALDFSGAGTATHVLVPHAEQLNFDVNAFSISLWLKWEEETNQAYLLHKGSFVENTGAGTSGKWYGLELKDGIIRFAVDDNQSKSEVSTSSSDFITGEWVHLVAIRDRENDVLSLYRNGVLVAEAKDNTNGGLRQSEPLYLGNSSDLNAPFTGQLDEVKIYNYGLSESEVAGIYTGIPMKAFKPYPADGATAVDPAGTVFRWSGDAATYDLYMGTSPDQLELLAGGLTDPSYRAGELATNTTYFWRVDAYGNESNATQSDVWSYTTGSVTGLEDPEFLKSYKLYPNPFSTQLNLEFNLPKQDGVTVSLYDMQNRLVAQSVLPSLQAGTHQISLQKESGLINLKQGVYLCILQTSDTRIVRRVIFRGDSR